MSRTQKIYRYTKKIEQSDAFNNIEDMCNWMKLLVENTVPEYARGPVNQDFINTHCLDMNNLAVIIAGYRKVMLWWDDKTLTSNMMKVLSFYKLNYNKIPNTHKYVIFTDDSKLEAEKLTTFMSKNKKESECLGYPQKDIDYFMSDKKKEWRKKANKNELIDIE